MVLGPYGHEGDAENDESDRKIQRLQQLVVFVALILWSVYASVDAIKLKREVTGYRACVVAIDPSLCIESVKEGAQE